MLYMVGPWGGGPGALRCSASSAMLQSIYSSTALHPKAKLDMRGASKGPSPRGNVKTSRCSNDLCMNVLAYCCCTCCCAAAHRGSAGRVLYVLLLHMLLHYYSQYLLFMIHAGACARSGYPPFFLTTALMDQMLLHCGSLNAHMFCFHGTFSFLPVYRSRGDEMLPPLVLQRIPLQNISSSSISCKVLFLYN